MPLRTSQFSINVVKHAANPTSAWPTDTPETPHRFKPPTEHNMPGRTKERDTSSQDDVNMDDAPTSAQPDARPVGEDIEGDEEQEEQEEEQEPQRVRIVRQPGCTAHQCSCTDWPSLISCLARRTLPLHSSSLMRDTRWEMRCGTLS